MMSSESAIGPQPIAEEEASKEKAEPKYNQKHYDMLMRCSIAGDMTEWNKWREEDLENIPHLEGANLSGADLCRANLNGANLSEANFEGAKLREAFFYAANLQDAELRKAKGLLAEQFSGANVCNAKLPEDIQRFDVLGHVEEASKSARRILLTMLLGCAYSWLAIATTTDSRLLNNWASSPLPIIGSAIPIVPFYWAAPVLLLGIYVYFHLCMQRLWEGLADLPAKFPDGRDLDKKIYPWLVTGLVRAHFKRLRKDRPAFSRLQALISILLAWWVVPFTMLLFWIRYLKRHDWFGTSLHILLFSVSIFAGIWFYHSAVTTLRKEGWQIHSCKIILGTLAACTLARLGPQIDHWIVLRYNFERNEMIAFLVAILIAAIFGCLGFFLIERSVRHSRIQVRIGDTVLTATLGTFLFLLCIFAFSYGAISGLAGGYTWARANLEKQDVSIRLEDWDEDNIERVRKASLRGANLKYCMAEGAFMVYADLQRANLSSARLPYADLRGADLRNADLSGADLTDADFTGAILTGTDFTQAQNLTCKQLMSGEDWRHAIHDLDCEEEISQSLPHQQKQPIEKTEASPIKGKP